MTEQTRQELEAQLAAARAARHKLMIGGKTASISYQGRSVTYNAASIDKLDLYIREIEMKLRGGRARSRPIGF